MLEQRMIGQPAMPGARARNVDAIVDLVRAGALKWLFTIEGVVVV